MNRKESFYEYMYNYEYEEYYEFDEGELKEKLEEGSDPIKNYKQE